MAATYTKQYRPISDRETATNDGLSIRTARDMADSLNNASRWSLVHKTISQICIPTWQSNDQANTDEEVLMVFAPFPVPESANVLTSAIGHRLIVGPAGAGTVTVRLYCTTFLYVGDNIMDTTKLVSSYTSMSFNSTSATHAINVDRTLTMPKSIGGAHGGLAWLVLTAENAAGNQVEITTFDVTPRYA